MKKLVALLLATVLTLSTFAACGGAKLTAKVIDIELTSEDYAFGVDKNQPELLTSVNAFIAKIMEDGTFEVFRAEGKYSPYATCNSSEWLDVELC